MKLFIDQPIAVSAERAQATLAAPDFYRSLGALPNISAPDVLSHQAGADGSRVSLALRYHFTGQLSGTARRVLGGKDISWEQHSDVDLTSGVTRVVMASSTYPSLFSFSAWYKISSSGQDGCFQHLEADLSVHIPVLGALAERAIASGVRQNLAATATLVEAYASGTQ